MDLKKIPELTALSYSPAAGLTLGASVPCYRIYENHEVSAAYPALADAARIVGGWQIQSRASVGGNLCNSSPAADTIPPLIALGARCQIAGPGGPREVAAEAFCTAPGKNVLQRGRDPDRDRLPASRPEERLGLRAVHPAERDGHRGRRRGVVGPPECQMADTIDEARVALAAVAPTPLFAEEASTWLAGKPATEKTFAQAGELARKIARPISDMRGTVEFRVHLVGVLVGRTLARAVERAAAAR